MRARVARQVSPPDVRFPLSLPAKATPVLSPPRGEQVVRGLAPPELGAPLPAACGRTASRCRRPRCGTRRAGRPLTCGPTSGRPCGPSIPSTRDAESLCV